MNLYSPDLRARIDYKDRFTTLCRNNTGAESRSVTIERWNTMNRINKPLLFIAIAFITALVIYIGIAFLTEPKEEGPEGRKDAEQSQVSETDASKGNKDPKDAAAKGEQAGAGPEAGKETEGRGKHRADANDESGGAETKGGANAEDKSAETDADGTGKQAGETTATEASGGGPGAANRGSGTDSAGSDEASGFYRNIKTADTSKGVRILCNKNYKLPDDFVPASLSDMDAYSVYKERDNKLQSEAAEAFMRMADAASAEGVTIKIVSGYRDKVYQEGLYNTYAANNGTEEADTYSARPRHSEHETGLCCDINDVNAAFEYTQAYHWLQEHGAEYGYILRYPKGKEAITGYIYEPWHWRYVSKDTAIAVKDSALTYDEYYKQYLEN